MIKKAFLTLSLASTVLFFLSCEKEDQLDLNEETAEPPSDITEVAVHLSEEGPLEFTDKASLAKLLEEMDKTTFNAKVQELTKNGFQSLRPIFDDLEFPEVQNFLLTLGYGIDSGNVNFDFFKQFKTKKYDVAKVDIYGLALRNGTIKGSKVIAAD